MAAPFQISTTPNPNSIRVGLTESKYPKAATYRSAQDAAGDPLVLALFGIPGVNQVFTLNNFITITKDAAASWERLEPKVAEVLLAKLHG